MEKTDDNSPFIIENINATNSKVYIRGYIIREIGKEWKFHEGIANLEQE